MQMGVIFAGFGGQGVLLSGQLLALAALEQGLEAAWIPSYGPEMRGGTAHAMVTIADSDIGCPVVDEPDALVVFNTPALARFGPKVKAGGLVVADADLVDGSSFKGGADFLELPATTLAASLGAIKSANMLLLGALAARTGPIKPDSFLSALEKMFQGERGRFLLSNRRAFEQGWAYISPALAQ